MRRRRRGVDGVRVSVVWFGVLSGGGAGYIRPVVVGLVSVCALGLAGSAAAASVPCPNAALRVGPSASLPDCRAYELVTPTDKGRTQDMTFGTGNDRAIPSSDGEHIALETTVPLEPDAGTPAGVIGARAVFSRNQSGWTMESLVAPGASADRIELSSGAGLFSPDLSQVAFKWDTQLNQVEESPYENLEVGPVGGPYTLVASVPREHRANFLGANEGRAGAPAFSDVLFESNDHALSLSEPEQALAEATVEGAEELYDWTDEHLRLVNVEGEGANVKLVDKCGARLGEGADTAGGAGSTNAISEDGSKIFFTTPHSGASCEGPPRLFVRVNGRETVEVPAPAGSPVHYNGATPDGSEVFFTAADNLFEYDTLTGVLTHIASELTAGFELKGITPYVVVSEDGSTVYYETEAGVASGFVNIFHYNTRNGETNFVATARGGHFSLLSIEPSYTTPNGAFLVFAADSREDLSVVGELRGAGHQELYRYDNANKTVMCVSCGEGVAPAGEMFEPNTVSSLRTEDETPPLIPMSDNGQRIFFQTTAQLVPQDTNSTEFNFSYIAGTPGMDVYEWEADGTEEAPGVFCPMANGCTHLISAGEDTGPSFFLGASSDGSNVFFSTASRLVPQDTDEFGDIYDARVDGGFPPPPGPTECLSCQGVGRPAPLFGPGASGSFAGTGSQVAPVVKAKSKPKAKAKRRRKKRGRRKSQAADAGRGGKRS
jgi:hypothetical protein